MDKVGVSVPPTDRALLLLTFSDLSIDQDMVDALATKGILEPFPIQTQTHPDGPRRPGHHRPGQDRHRQDARVRPPAAAGDSGSTPSPGVKALVVVPTRELCVQVAEDLDAGLQQPRRRRSSRSTAARPTRARSSSSRPARRSSSAPPAGCSTSPSQRLLSLDERQGDGARRGRQDARPRLPRPTSRSSSRRPRRPGTPCCSRRRCPARSSRSPAAS